MLGVKYPVRLLSSLGVSKTFQVFAVFRCVVVSRHGCPPGRGKKRVPFFAAQRNGKRFDTGPQSIGARRSQHGLDLRRVFEQPRQQDGLRGGFVTPGIFLHQRSRFSDVFGLTIQFPCQGTLG